MFLQKRISEALVMPVSATMSTKRCTVSYYWSARQNKLLYSQAPPPLKAAGIYEKLVIVLFCYVPQVENVCRLYRS